MMLHSPDVLVDLEAMLDVWNSLLYYNYGDSAYIVLDE